MKNCDQAHADDPVWVPLLVDGKLPNWLPPEARPDCQSCPKPELDASNMEALEVFGMVQNQQTYGGFAGERLGVRLDVLIATMDELERGGRSLDRARTFRRVLMLDRVVNRISNDRLRAQMDNKKGK